VGLGARKRTTNEQLQMAGGRIKALHSKPLGLGPQNPKPGEITPPLRAASEPPNQLPSAAAQEP
jgi:hypothetical protein